MMQIRFDKPFWRVRPMQVGVGSFAFLAGVEAIIRGMTLSVYPLVIYHAFGSAVLVSKIYFIIGVLSLFIALWVPLISTYIPRRWVYSFGMLCYIIAGLLGIYGGKVLAFALMLNSIATAISFVCYNAYVLSNIKKADFSQLETKRLFYGGLGWTIGPVFGVWLLSHWVIGPFVIVILGACCMISAFWRMRLGNGPVFNRNKRPSPNPFIYIPRFFSQPRLVAGWFFAVMRSCGWWVFIVYAGIFAIQKGLGDHVGGMATSVANMGLFLSPLMLRWMQKHSVRHAVIVGFLGFSALSLLAVLFSQIPIMTVLCLTGGAYFLVLLDICGGLPFLMAVKPSERNEMSAVYSTFRDVSGILTPGVAWLVLQFLPLVGLFVVTAMGALIAAFIATKLHRQLGVEGANRLRSVRALG